MQDTAYARMIQQLTGQPCTWLVTGVAGFIGSHLLEALLKINQRVVGLDNFSTGYAHYLDEVRQQVSAQQWANFHFIQGDIANAADCGRCCQGVDYVLHQAALGSVPGSIADPLSTHQVNVDGFFNMLLAARHAGVKRLVYASSSSVYGDDEGLIKHEDCVGHALSPYAMSKRINELYADVFSRTYGISVVGLRYFNIFGRRQHPAGAYAAVIPKWTAALLNGQPVDIHGDGETSRDFCHVQNVVQANILAATAGQVDGQVYNVAMGGCTTLNQLFALLKKLLAPYGVAADAAAQYRDFRAGDIRHSQANMDRAIRMLGYCPEYPVAEGLEEAIPWYVAYARQHQGYTP